MKPFPPPSSLFCVLFSVAVAGPQELAPDLNYLRVHRLAADLPALEGALSGPRALVLDLRHATATEDAAHQLRSALTRQPAGRTFFILVGPATPPIVTDALPGGAMTLGIFEANPAPRVPVRQPADADRRAYDALEAGTPLATLISGRMEKERYDEAMLVQEFQNGNPSPEPPPPPDPTAAKPAAPEVPPTDRVLQRAVHLHRALLALRPRPPG